MPRVVVLDSVCAAAAFDGLDVALVAFFATVRPYRESSGFAGALINIAAANKARRSRNVPRLA
ncbi:hypothetical protein GCM10008097_00660 [Mycetocola manganoxydans]|nr:hypothetical protein GCM10008097_00660 [Mycetocola manganoxydans]